MGEWEDIVDETQAWITVESLSEIFQLKERCSILKGEVGVLKQEVKQCSERQAQLHEVESFLIPVKVFLEVSALHTVPKGWNLCTHSWWHKKGVGNAVVISRSGGVEWIWILGKIRYFKWSFLNELFMQNNPRSDCDTQSGLQSLLPWLFISFSWCWGLPALIMCWWSRDDPEHNVPVTINTFRYTDLYNPSTVDEISTIIIGRKRKTVWLYSRIFFA